MGGFLHLIIYSLWPLWACLSSSWCDLSGYLVSFLCCFFFHGWIIAPSLDDHFHWDGGRYAITLMYTPSIFHAVATRYHSHDLSHFTSFASPSCSSSPTPSTASMASKLEEHNLLLLLASFLTTGDYHNVLVNSGQWSMLSLFDNILFSSWNFSRIF